MKKDKMASNVNLTIRDVFTTRNGAKIASIMDGDGDLVFQPKEYLRMPFEPSAFDKSERERLNLMFETTTPILEAFERLDEWLIQYIAEHSERILKKRFSLDQVRANYSSCIRMSEKGYPATLKTKLDLGTGKHAVFCWDDDGNQVDTPKSWCQCLIRPRLHVTHLWMMGNACGPVVRLTDAKLRYDNAHLNAPRPLPRSL